MNNWTLFGSTSEVLLDCAFDPDKERDLANKALYRIARSLGFQPEQINVVGTGSDSFALFINNKEIPVLEIVKQ